MGCVVSFFALVCVRWVCWDGERGDGLRTRGERGGGEWKVWGGERVSDERYEVQMSKTAKS